MGGQKKEVSNKMKKRHGFLSHLRSQSRHVTIERKKMRKIVRKAIFKHFSFSQKPSSGYISCTPNLRFSFMLMA